MNIYFQGPDNFQIIMLGELASDLTDADISFYVVISVSSLFSFTLELMPTACLGSSAGK